MTIKSPKYFTVLAYLIACLGILAVFYVAQSNPLDGQEGQGLSRFFGRFHPLVLHFPVACLVMAALFELLGTFSRLSFLRRPVGPLLFFSALSAVATVILGILLAANEGHQGALIERHRMAGISVAVLSCLAWAMYVSATNVSELYVSAHKPLLAKLSQWGYRASLFAAVSVMSFAAHDGGSLVHGPNYLAEHSPAALVPILTNHLPEEKASAENIQSQTEHGKTFITQATHARFGKDVEQMLEGYCLRCHGASKQEANLRLDKVDPSFNKFNSQGEWHRILGVLGSHRMPPEAAKQPSDQQRMNAIDWIQTALEEHAYARRAEMANTPLRRLNKREINHTYQDLFEVDADFVSRLPADPKSAHGYDNDAELLMVSMSDINSYHGIARQAVERYVQFGKPRPQQAERYFVELEDVYHYGRGKGDWLSYERAAKPLSKDKLQHIKADRKGKKVIYRDRFYGPLPYGTIPQGKSKAGEGRGFARLHEQFMLLRTSNTVGQVTVKVNAAMTAGNSGNMNEAHSVPRLRLEAGWRNEQSLRVKNVGEYDITQSLDQPQTVEFTFRLEDVIEPATARGEKGSQHRWILLVLSNVARHPQGLLAASEFGQLDLSESINRKPDDAVLGQTKKAIKQQVAGWEHWQKSGVPLLYLDALEAEIVPTIANHQSPWFVKYPGPDASIELQKDKLKRVLADYLPQVFRKQNISEETYATYLNLYQKLRQQGDSFERAVRETMAAALISPEFLYIGYSQNQPQENASQVYENEYLASRLAYYLWSSMPDKTLRQLANQQQLTDPAVLAAQVERMLASPKAKRFTDTFARQWLQLAKLEDVTVSADIYPTYGAELSALAARQSVLTFQDNFHQNRDARELYFSDYMLLNQPLAELYQVPKVTGGDFVRVKIPDYPPRLGLMTQASVLAMNSDGEDSHPIKRGVWMLERLLNDPPPPPPPSVPDLDPNNPLLAGLSLKQKIEQHRELSGCSGCHEKIDPWGILMENYDATGKWRSEVSVYKKIELDKEERKKLRKKHIMETVSTMGVDASSVLPDGRKISSVTELSSYLQKHKQKALTHGLVQHMMMYALGRELDILDEQESEVIFSTFRASGYKLSALVQAIVNSDGFTNRQQLSAQKVSAQKVLAQNTKEKEKQVG